MKSVSVSPAISLRFCRAACLAFYGAMLGPLVVPWTAYANPQSEPAPSASTSTTEQQFLNQLFDRFARMRGMSATFREEKTLALLAAPLVNEGIIYFAKPHHFVRNTQTPIASSLRIEGNRLVVSDAGGITQLDLQAANPAIERFISSFIYIYAGNRQALERLYDFTCLLPSSSQATQWKLTLTPKDSFIAKMLTKIEIEGNDLAIHTMRIFEVGGDHSTMTFTDIQMDRQFNAEEFAQIFRDHTAKSSVLANQ